MFYAVLVKTDLSLGNTENNGAKTTLMKKKKKSLLVLF